MQDQPIQSPIRVTVWNEFHHEKVSPEAGRHYPHGMHATMREAIEQHLGQEVTVRTATLDEPEHGLSEAVLHETDVLTWWGHARHEDVSDAVVDRIQQRVLEGMGLVVLHSGHGSKPFRRLMGTSCMLWWREAGERERLWCVRPGHPIADGLDEEYIELDQTEMYGEFFDVPPPDELIFISWFEGGEVFRSGAVWHRGKGKVFFWRPGHETFPLYHAPAVRRVLANGVKYVAPCSSAPVKLGGRNRPTDQSLSPIRSRST
jgi:trehalose utilization protein